MTDRISNTDFISSCIKSCMRSSSFVNPVTIDSASALDAQQRPRWRAKNAARRRAAAARYSALVAVFVFMVEEVRGDSVLVVEVVSSSVVDRSIARLEKRRP